MHDSETKGNPAPREVAFSFSFRRDAIAFLLLLLALATLFLPVHLRGLSTCSLPLEHDVGFQWIPFKEFQAQALGQGYFPLWTERVFAGMPFLAFSHTGVLYPLGWILLAGDYARAVNLFYPLHLLIAGCGLYFLFLRLRNSRPAAWLAAASVVFTGHFFYFIHFLPSTCTIAWSPWLMLAFLELARSGKFSWLALLILSLGLQILGGDVESTVYGLGFGLLFLLLFRWRDPEFPSLRPLLWGVGLALALILVLAQFLPLLEYSQHFIRAKGVTFDYYRQRVLPPELAAALVWPVTKVRGLETTLADAPYLYLSLLSLFFAFLALLRRPQTTSRPLALLALFTLTFSFGSLEFLDRILYRLPLLNKFGAPEHAFYLFQIFLGLLAGQGMDHFLCQKPRARRFTLISFVILSLFLIGWGHFHLVLFPGIGWVLAGLGLTLLLAVFSPLNRPLAIAALALVFALDTWTWAYHYLPRHDPKIFRIPAELPEAAGTLEQNPGRYLVLSRLGLQDPTLLHHLGFRIGLDSLDGWITVPPIRYAELLNRVDPRAASFKQGKLDALGLNVDFRDGLFLDAPSLPLLDLLSLRYFFNRQIPLKFASPSFLAFSDPEHWLKPNPVAVKNAPARPPTATDLILGAPERVSYRLYLEPGDRLRFGYQAVSALVSEPCISAVILLRQGDTVHLLFARAVDSTHQGLSTPPILSLEPWSGKEAILSLATLPRPCDKSSFRWQAPAIVNLDRPIQLFGFAGAPEDPSSVAVYQNREALPRAFIAHQVEVIPKDQELLDRLASMPTAHLRRTLLLSRTSPAAASLERLSGTAIGLPPEPVDPIEDFPDRKSFHLIALRPGYLFVNDQFLPGWRAWVDGKEWKIETADYCFRAVFLDHGVHQVVFSYQPLSFRIGLWTSLTSLGCLILGWTSRRRVSNRKI